jgi:5-(carboxyamino)imidazole ribonucleotide synthase
MKRLLVIGDGQLGLMLAEAASRLGLAMDRLAPEEGLLFHGTGRQAARVPDDWRAMDYDILTAEREHLPTNALMTRLAEHPGFGAYGAIATLADRRTQKALLDRLQIPTADWCVVESQADIERLAHASGGPVVVKAAQGGYDGRGQWRVDATSAAAAPAALYGRLIAERSVRFSRELSLVGARAADGRCVFYPLVENRHRQGMLRCTVAPARAARSAQQRAVQMLQQIMEELRYVGVMAVELFEEDGELLVNELAPRVHNSGHWTQDGATLDQFELHLRALCGLPMPVLRAEGHAVMINLVGCDFDPAWLAVPQARLHWYGKEQRAGRKLGHLNLRAPTRRALSARLAALAPLLDRDHALAVQEASEGLQPPGEQACRTALPCGNTAQSGLHHVPG